MIVSNTGWIGRAFGPISRASRSKSDASTSNGSFSTYQCTPSVQGGRVNEPR